MLKHFKYWNAIVTGLQQQNLSQTRCYFWQKPRITDYSSCPSGCSRTKTAFRERVLHMHDLLAPQDVQREWRTCYVCTGTLRLVFPLVCGALLQHDALFCSAGSLSNSVFQSCPGWLCSPEASRVTSPGRYRSDATTQWCHTETRSRRGPAAATAGCGEGGGDGDALRPH